jgi:tetratricopeptide (TPR) repeat protein
MKYTFAGLSIVLLIVTFVFCDRKGEDGKDQSRLPYRNLSDSARYVGMNTCRECHGNIYETFIQTGMGQSFDLASRKKSAARFDRHSLIYDQYSDFYYKPFWSGDTLKIMEFRLDGKDTVHKRTERVDYIIGSGQHTNSHMMNVNGYIYQMPMTFYTQKGRWDLPPGFENGVNTRFSRVIELECMSCHNSYPGFVKGSVNKYTEVPGGINCERCHGPGSIHVEEKRSGKLVDINKVIDWSIVNPAKLPVDLQFEICQRCHLQGNTVLNENRSFYDFKPGMRLSEVMNVFVPRQEQHDEYIMASHVERLKMSPCFTVTMQDLQKGKAGSGNQLRPYKDAMTCVTCHNPHVSVTVTGEEVFNNACRNCHGGKDGRTVCSRPAPDPLTGDCVSCHMPKSTTIDIPHVTATDHFIRKPVKKKEIEKVKRFLGIRCVNNTAPERSILAKAYIQYFEKFGAEKSSLDSAEKYLLKEGLNKNTLESWVHLYYMKKDFRKVTEAAEKIGMRDILKDQRSTFSNEFAYLDYRIGDSYYVTERYEQAEKYLSTACRLAPYHPDFKNRYGALLMKLDRPQEAFGIFTEIVKENPKHVSALCNLGYLYLVIRNDTKKAGELYDRCLSLDPDYEQGLLNKAGLLINLGEYAKAGKYLRRLVKKHPGNRVAQELLEKLNSVL